MLVATQNQTLFSQGNSTGFTVEISGGYSLINGNLSTLGFPFGLAKSGPSIHTGLYFNFAKNWGISLVKDFSWHAYRGEEAGQYFLSQDALAISTTVRSGSFYIGSLSPGVFYNLNVNRRWTMRARAGAGMVTVFTPEIDIDLITEPLTQIKYASGNTSSIQYNFALHPSYRIHDQLGLNGIFQFMHGSPTIEIEETGGQTTSQNISFTRFSLGLGLTYYFGKKISKEDLLP